MRSLHDEAGHAEQLAQDARLANEKQEEKKKMNINGYNFLLQDFCAYCEHFTPEVEQLTIREAVWGEMPKCINNIRCKNRMLCARLMEHLEKKHGETAT